MRELESLLPELDPPRGGLARLRHSVQARRGTHRATRWLSAMTAAVALLAALLWLPSALRNTRHGDAQAHALLQAVAPPIEGDGIKVEHGAALALNSGQTDARLYLVAIVPADHAEH